MFDAEATRSDAPGAARGIQAIDQRIGNLAKGNDHAGQSHHQRERSGVEPECVVGFRIPPPPGPAADGG